MTAQIGRTKTTVRLTDENVLFLDEYSKINCSWKNSIINKLIEDFRNSPDVQEKLKLHQCKSAHV